MSLNKNRRIELETKGGGKRIENRVLEIGFREVSMVRVKLYILKDFYFKAYPLISFVCFFGFI